MNQQLVTFIQIIVLAILLLGVWRLERRKQMKKTVIVCDKCGKMQDKEPYHKFSLFKGRRSNGNEREDWNWVSDLCPNCTSQLATRLTKVLAALPNDQLKIEITTQFNCREE